MVRVATLVNHYRQDLLTDAAVASLLAQTHAHDIFVIDCCSPAPYHTDKCPVLRMHEPSNLSQSLNWGMELMRGYDFVWQFTNDVVAPAGVLQSLVSVLCADPHLAAVQPSMPSSHGHLCPHEGWLIAHCRYLEWAAPLVSQIAWADVGPLDEGFGFFSMDIDWSYRARQLGWKLAVDYTVVCKHEFRGTHNATKFSISGQGAKEDAYGKSKFGRPDWQQWLLGKVS